MWKMLEVSKEQEQFVVHHCDSITWNSDNSYQLIQNARKVRNAMRRYVDSLNVTEGEGFRMYEIIDSTLLYNMLNYETEKSNN